MLPAPPRPVGTEEGEREAVLVCVVRESERARVGRTCCRRPRDWDRSPLAVDEMQAAVSSLGLN